VSALKRAQPPSARAEPHDLAVSGVNDLASSSAAGQRHARHGRIRKWDATDAAVHDSQKLDDMLDDNASICPNTDKGVWADSAYPSGHKLFWWPKQRNAKEENEAIKGWEKQPAKNSISAGGHRVRFVGTWREEFFEVPI
jgi:hypothetical protein